MRMQSPEVIPTPEEVAAVERLGRATKGVKTAVSVAT